VNTEVAPLRALIVAVPETAGSALYGMLDVLGAAGNLWQTLVRTEPERKLIEPAIISLEADPFRCGNNIPVSPDFGVKGAPAADIVIAPELWLGPDEDLKERYPDLMSWIRSQYENGSYVYSACSGSIMLAEAGLLDNRTATSHWGYENLFRTAYPKVRFDPDPTLCFADPSGRLVTAGGTTSWHDLAIHIISKHCGPGEAAKIAKAYLLKQHDEGQTPYASLVTAAPHADSAVRKCEQWLTDHFTEANCVSRVAANANIPERSLKRRFKAATGKSLLEYLQGLRIEKAKGLLETSDASIDDICATVGYEEPAFFRRLFKRLTGLTPASYRKMFKTTAASAAERPMS
jgi:transcriptional regulator GlxA family with amidase domain